MRRRKTFWPILRHVRLLLSLYPRVRQIEEFREHQGKPLPELNALLEVDVALEESVIAGSLASVQERLVDLVINLGAPLAPWSWWARTGTMPSCGQHRCDGWLKKVMPVLTQHADQLSEWCGVRARFDRMNDYTVLARGPAVSRRACCHGRWSVLVVEIRRGTLTRVDVDGKVEVVATPGGGPNGAAIGPDGACYLCNNGGFTWQVDEQGARPTLQPKDYSGGRIERVDPVTGKVEVLYREVDGVPLRGPNDIVFLSSRGFFFYRPWQGALLRSGSWPSILCASRWQPYRGVDPSVGNAQRHWALPGWANAFSWPRHPRRGCGRSTFFRRAR
ncbi:MAG: hypothetical protein CM1200mP41_07490 [Gammaproteobacteria bacterium]|nr:MAG: hypothetical protein CM1200mP41_07490 [Gammaproteobacteria bacterium]